MHLPTAAAWCTLVSLISISKGGGEGVAAFEFPKVPSLNLPWTTSSTLPQNRANVLPNNKIRETKRLLLESISNTDNGKSATLEQQAKVLEIVQTLESLAPSSVIQNILTDPKEATKIDGVWYLQYTSPSTLGDDDQFPDAWKPVSAQEGAAKIDTNPVRMQGTVRAVGLTVDAANRVVQQIFDVSKSRVLNKIDLGWGRVEVEGDFRPSTSVPNRAIVGFDRAEIFVGGDGNDSNNVEGGIFKIDLSWLFAILRFFKGGIKDNGWVETTYIDEDIRIGRGNKGTLFVITRSPDLKGGVTTS